jgi:hypothetical protein
MIIFETKPLYSQTTGKLIGNSKVGYGHRCDFCGAALWEQDYSPYCRYMLDYESSDPCMGSDGDEYEFGKKYDIDMHQFLYGAYAFCAAPDFECEAEFFKWYVAKMADQNLNTLEGALREVRVMTADKLLTDGTIKAEDLKDE